MKKIIFATIGLAMFATPLAAGTSSGVSQHQKHLYGLDPNTPTVQVPVINCRGDSINTTAGLGGDAKIPTSARPVSHEPWDS